MRPCIDLIDSLRALGVEQDLALPAIAVIGDQSSGKSSVLEALSGVALPRGSGKNLLSVLISSGSHNKMPQTGWLKQRLISHSSGGWKSKTKVLAWLVSPEAFLLVQMTISLCPQMAFSLCTHTSGISSLFCMDASHLGPHSSDLIYP